MDFAPLFTIRKYSHFFLVLNPSIRILNILHTFCMRYAQKEYVREPGMRYPVLKPTKVFAARTKDNTEFRFHIGQLGDLIKLLEDNAVTPNLYRIEEVPVYEPTAINYELKEGWVLKDFQEKIVDYVSSPIVLDLYPGAQYTVRSRLAALPTGKGKTVAAMGSASRLKSRVVVAVLPKYIDKWISDVKNLWDIDESRMMVVQGSPQLRGLISMAKEGRFDSDVTIISVTTLQSLYKLYELDPKSLEDMGFECMPHELFELLGTGLVIIDETHQHIHAVFKLMLYAHVPMILALSATLLATDPVVEMVHKVMYPHEIRFEEVKPDKYIKVYTVDYRFRRDELRHIRTSEYGSSTYSHTAFEKSLMRRPWIQKSYFEMIDFLIHKGYLEDKMEGDKLIIFVSTIAMATMLTKWLKEKYPELDVRRYVENDPYENVIQADIRVTTPLSAGTALDIPNLRSVIQTIAIKSPVQNLQNLGRLRELKDRDTKFFYTYCHQIPKHVQYHKERSELYLDRVATIKDYPYLTEL